MDTPNTKQLLRVWHRILNALRAGDDTGGRPHGALGLLDTASTLMILSGIVAMAVSLIMHVSYALGLVLILFGTLVAVAVLLFDLVRRR